MSCVSISVSIAYENDGNNVKYAKNINVDSDMMVLLNKL